MQNNSDILQNAVDLLERLAKLHDGSNCEAVKTAIGRLMVRAANKVDKMYEQERRYVVLIDDVKCPECERVGHWEWLNDPHVWLCKCGNWMQPDTMKELMAGKTMAEIFPNCPKYAQQEGGEA